ncbi:ADP-ribosylglycohydrolase family protein [uncultured Bifidobacterium sp.]|uniref:ADP-ribosylglycohydrolase family protein n=1 Tax=uncultured Bifidobacterium sp. TaxID=165187 RepID=UPI002598C44C|nr:ADP-ribosylglycohydrolase family protein [uncultured Bifidobacterium sp.]
MMTKATLHDAVYGQAVGDALGVPYEFRARGSFDCTGMTGFGTHDQPAGTWSDDTSMMLAICDSIRVTGRIDCDDIRERFVRWYRHGDYTVGGTFDVGNTTRVALTQGHGLANEWDNGNGSLMRTVPLAFTAAGDDEIREVSAITHAHPVSCDACVLFVHIARLLADGATPSEAVQQAIDADCATLHEDVIASLAGEHASALSPGASTVGRLLSLTSEDGINSGGYVLDTLRAAVWCLLTTETYADCVRKAVNLGADTDTTAAVAGALAGIAYGTDAIPARWMETLRGKEIIETVLFTPQTTA